MQVANRSRERRASAWSRASPNLLIAGSRSSRAQAARPPSPRESPWTTAAAAARTGASWSGWSHPPRTRGRDDRRRRLRRAAAGALISAAQEHRHRRALDGLALLPHRRDRDEHTASRRTSLRAGPRESSSTSSRPDRPARRVRLPVLRRARLLRDPKFASDIGYNHGAFLGWRSFNWWIAQRLPFADPLDFGLRRVARPRRACAALDEARDGHRRRCAAPLKDESRRRSR